MWRPLTPERSFVRTLEITSRDDTAAFLSLGHFVVEDRARGQFFRAALSDVKSVTWRPHRDRAAVVVRVGLRAYELDGLSIDFATRICARIAPMLPLAPPSTVDLATLDARPIDFHGTVVRVKGRHEVAMECSTLGRAWLDVPRELAIRPSGGTVDVVALVVADPLRADPSRGYGHLGLYPAWLHVYRYTPVG